MRFLCYILLTNLLFCDGLHISGEWDTSDFFHYVTRFGFQKAIKNKEEETQVVSQTIPIATVVAVLLSACQSTSIRSRIFLSHTL